MVTRDKKGAVRYIGPSPNMADAVEWMLHQTRNDLNYLEGPITSWTDGTKIYKYNGVLLDQVIVDSLHDLNGMSYKEAIPLAYEMQEL